MRIHVNEHEMIVDDSYTVTQLLSQITRDKQPCAVEVNRELVPKSEHGTHRLNEGDVIEIVTLVGGG